MIIEIKFNVLIIIIGGPSISKKTEGKLFGCGVLVSPSLVRSKAKSTYTDFATVKSYSKYMEICVKNCVKFTIIIKIAFSKINPILYRII